eukprot:3624002-Lingulodinium_polyedra.AAC.1
MLPAAVAFRRGRAEEQGRRTPNAPTPKSASCGVRARATNRRSPPKAPTAPLPHTLPKWGPDL